MLCNHLLAHELFHIVLRKQRYPTEVRDGLTSEQRSGTDWGRVVVDATTAVINCYQDARIDRLMSARGFEPKILNRREANNTIAEGLQMQPGPSGLPLLLRKDYALTNYCLSIRERDFDMGDIYKSLEQCRSYALRRMLRRSNRGLQTSAMTMCLVSAALVLDTPGRRVFYFLPLAFRPRPLR